MSPCPNMAKHDTHHRNQRNEARHVPKLAWVRGPGIYQPTTLWSFLANTFFPSHPVIALQDTQWQMTQADKRPKRHRNNSRFTNQYDGDGERDFMEWCFQCHQYHPLASHHRRDRAPKAPKLDVHAQKDAQLLGEQRKCACNHDELHGGLQHQPIHQQAQTSSAFPAPSPDSMEPNVLPHSYVEDDNNGGIDSFVKMFSLHRRHNAVLDDILPPPSIEMQSMRDELFNNWTGLHGQEGFGGERGWMMSGSLGTGGIGMSHSRGKLW